MRQRASVCNRVVLPLLFLIATSATHTSAPRPKALAACSAVTAEDVHLALGIHFRRAGETASTCDYTAGNAQVSVSIQQLKAPIDIAAEIAALKLELPGSTARIVNSVGGEAFLLEIAGAGAQVHAIRGERDYVMISILGLGDADAVGPAAERLARAALARL
ncbi:MAG: hypothetical protein JWP63_4001 [Candidatus Solibacter sp.]|nr:hypothetical protein [Candidatus Solibacter sp.]